jgi:hypothetical protein
MAAAPPWAVTPPEVELLVADCASVAYEYQVSKLNSLSQPVHLGGHGVSALDVALEELDRDGAPLGIGHSPVGHLGKVGSMVAAITLLWDLGARL